MHKTFFARQTLFGISNALLILFLVFFLLPIMMRGARQSLNKTNNDVKDWLPSDFAETKELEWFGDYFAGERFVLATWPGCTEDDQRLQLLVQKLQAESVGAKSDGSIPDLERARKLGSELELLAPSDFQVNYGGRNEKWLISASGQHYFITPDGRLFRWSGKEGPMPALIRRISKSILQRPIEGQFIAAFETAGEGPNPFYTNPRLFTAPLFRSVQTGPNIAAELSREGGPLWPVAAIDASAKGSIARRLAEQRLTGTLFAPAVPEGFAWTATAFVEKVSDADRSPELTALAATAIQEIIDRDYGGDVTRLKADSTEAQASHWHAVFDAMGVPAPPRQTCVLVTLTPIALDNLPYAVGRGLLGGTQGRLLQLAQQCGINPAAPPSPLPPPFAVAAATVEPSMRMGGPPVDNVSIDEEGQITLIRLIGYCVLLGLTLSMLAFRSFKITTMVFFVGVMSAMSSLAFVHLAGQNIDAILMSMPSLVYILGLSGAIHIINYYREEVHASGADGAAERALMHAFMPCTLAAVTTAIGLMSLNTSNIIPIKKFGFFSAVGVVATLALLFAYLPAALHVFRPAAGSPKPDAKANLAKQRRSDLLTAMWTRAGMWITSHYRIVATACLVVFVAAGLGITNTRTSVQLLKLFGSDSRIIQDYSWLENNFGKLVPMELVVRIPRSIQGEFADDKQSDANTLNRLERVQAVAHIQQAVEAAFGEQGSGDVGKAMSAVTLLPDLPEPSNSPTNPAKLAFNGVLESSQTQLLGTDYVKIETGGPWDGSELWRVSLRVGALSDVDYGQFVGRLRDAVEPVLQAYRYRDEILDALPAESKGVVFIVGAAQPAKLSNGVLRSSTDDRPPLIDQGEIFLSTLNDLLRNSTRIQVAKWISPEKIIDGPNKLEMWERNFKLAHCVVIAKDQSDFEVDFIRNNTGAVVDARIDQWPQTEPRVRDGVPEVHHAGPIQVVYTGIVPLVYKAQRTLLYSLIESTCWAFLLIALVMSGLLNPGSSIGFLHPKNLFLGLGAGLVSMIPNIFPVVVVFGLLGHISTFNDFGIIDLGKMMTASVAMGVAVDDTIHFLEWYRLSLAQGMTRRDAVIESYRRVGPAMTQTTILGGLGLFVFALSTFTPTQSFGTMMLFLLVAALVGDLVLLPALLVSPLGALFRPRTRDLIKHMPRDNDIASKPASSPEQIPVYSPLSSTPASRIDASHARSDQSAHWPPPNRDAESRQD